MLDATAPPMLRPSGMPRLKVAYVVSMRKGLHSFVFREIQQLRERNTDVVVLAISHGQGTYMPQQDWPTTFSRFRNLLRGLKWALGEDLKKTINTFLEGVATFSILDLAVALSFLPFLETHPVQSIHAHFGDHKLFTAYYVHRLKGLPLSVTVHAYELYSNPNPAMFRRSLAQCSAIVTISEYNRGILVNQFGVAKERIRVIHLFADRIPTELPSRVTRPLEVLCVARFVPKKGHDILLAALRQVVDTGHKEVRLTLVGNGPVDVEAIVDRLHLGPYVRVLEHVGDTELWQLYLASSVFCLASRTDSTGDREGIPVAIMEAMACGLPVVTTASAGIPELVQETLVPENNPEAIARALIDLMQDPRAARVQGLANRDIIRRGFSPSNVDELNETLRRVQHATL